MDTGLGGFAPPTGRRWVSGAAVLAAPLRGARWLVELAVREALAPLLVLPFLLWTEVRFGIARAAVRAEHRLARERARAIPLQFEATVAAVVRQFDGVQAAVVELDRRHSSLDPRFVESLETAQLAFAEAHRLLRRAAAEAQPLDELLAQVEALIPVGPPEG